MKRKKQAALTIVRKFDPKITKVIDSKKPISIWIVKRDVKRKGIKDHKNCAVAEACKRAFDADSAIIGTRTAYIIFGKEALRFRIPERTSKEIKSFDRGQGFRMGVFALVPPNKGEKLGGGYTGASHKLSKRKRPHFKKHDRDVRAMLK